MSRYRSLALAGLYVLAGIAASVSILVLFRVSPIRGELEALQSQVETMPERYLETTVPCPSTGLDVLVHTSQGTGTKAEMIADHKETVELVKADCALGGEMPEGAVPPESEVVPGGGE